jgi:hypothetical protein
MEFKKIFITESDILHSTDLNRYYAEARVKSSILFLSDGEKKKRLESVQCKFCFYMRTDRIGGASMTTRPCGICDDEMQFGSTCTDKICKKCAKEYDLCKYCGGDLEMRIRRKLRKELPCATIHKPSEQ